MMTGGVSLEATLDDRVNIEQVACFTTAQGREVKKIVRRPGTARRPFAQPHSEGV